MSLLEMDQILNAIVFLILLPLGLVLLFKPVSFLQKFNSPIESKKDLHRKLRYARYGAGVLLTYVILKTISLVVN